MTKYSQISKEDFKRLIEGVCHLIGYPYPPIVQLKLIYEKVQNYDVRDFEKACDDDEVLKNLSRQRNLCWPVLQEGIRKAQVARLEAENRQRKKEDRKAFEEVPAEVKKFIREILKQK